MLNSSLGLAQEEFVKRDGHIMATDLMLWCANNEPAAPAPGKDDFHMETVCTLVNIIGNAARSSVKVRTLGMTKVIAEIE